MIRLTKVAKHGDENEHKSAVNPNPQIEYVAPQPPKSTGNRKRVVIRELEDEDEAPAAAAASSSSRYEVDEVFELLTTEQNARKDKVYKEGDIVEVEYNAEGESVEQIGYGIVKGMIRHLSPNGHAMAHIVWIYERQDLIADNDELEESVLEDMDFEDGDYASSDHEQDVNVYNIVRTRNDEMRDLVKFFWDGTKLASLEAPAPRAELPRHLVLLKEWLLSYKIWKDTDFGSRWWFTINALMNIGHAKKNLSTRTSLQGFFFRKDYEPCISTGLTWERIIANEECDACGQVRAVTAKWVEKGWIVGKTCQSRIDALYQSCKYIQTIRATAEENKLNISKAWLERVSLKLDALGKTAQLAIAGDHRG
jgi:hypothetical protein